MIFAETGQIEIAERLLAPFETSDDPPPVQIRRVRHFIRAGRLEKASEIIEAWLHRPEAYMFYPYASIVWRVLDPERWEWLEGDQSFVGIYDIADRLPPLDELATTLRGLHKLSGHPLEQSLRGGSQTDGDIFMRIDPVLVRLRDAVQAAVADHVAQLPPPDSAHPLLSQKRGPSNSRDPGRSCFGKLDTTPTMFTPLDGSARPSMSRCPRILAEAKRVI